jgi:hypothetical protein
LSSSGIYHAVGTSSASNAILYINGISVNTDSTATSGNYNNSSKTCNIARSNSGGAYYSGTIYSLRVYSKTLSEAEVAQNYAATRGRFGL